MWIFLPERFQTFHDWEWLGHVLCHRIGYPSPEAPSANERRAFHVSAEQLSPQWPGFLSLKMFGVFGRCSKACLQCTHIIHTLHQRTLAYIYIYHLTIWIEIYSTHMHILYGSRGAGGVQYLMWYNLPTVSNTSGISHQMHPHKAWHLCPNVRCHSIAAFSPFFATWVNGNPLNKIYAVGSSDCCEFAYLL